MEKRQELAYFLHRLPDGVRNTASNGNFGDKEHVFRLLVNDDSIARFQRFVDIAANEATRTFNEGDKEKFYAPSGIAQLANATLKTEYQRTIAGIDKTTG